MNQSIDERQLRNGLERWRLSKLLAIAEQMNELNEDYRAAQDGLGIAHRNPGEIDEDVTEFLWEKLNSCAIEISELESQHQAFLELDLPHLIVSFQRSKKIKTWPWEVERWELVIF